MAKIIAVVNQKGGVGKTSTTVNLSRALKLLGKEVLVIDTDGQRNATDSFGVFENEENATLFDVLFEDVDAKDSIQKLDIVDLVAGDSRLTRSEQKFPMDGNRFVMLKMKFEALREKYDYIIIDTNPSLGTMMINVLTFVDSVIIPLEPNKYSLIGLKDLFSTIESVKGMNPSIEVEGFLLVKYDGREQLSKQFLSGLPEIAESMDVKMFDTKIRKCIGISKAQSKSISIFEYDEKSTGAEDYMKLAKEII